MGFVTSTGHDGLSRLFSL